MLWLDRRIGSGELEQPLVRLGIPVEILTLDFADCAFLGHGPEGENTMQLGIEIKKIHDLVSSIETGRLSGHQLPGLLRQYDAAWLIVEGLWRPGDDGVLELFRRGRWTPLEHGRRRYMYREIDNYLSTLEIKAGMRIRRTSNTDETARVIADLYGWWHDKAWEKHRSHMALHQPADMGMLVPPSLRRRVAAELPGVGHDRSGAVAGHFPNTLQMLMADVKEWQAIKGIGKTLATRIVDAIGRE